MFDCFFSLGHYCGNARSLSKLGLRSFSGPFDWVTSDLRGVLNCFEDDFEDFLMRKNIVVEDNGKVFQDVKHGFRFPHEIEKDFENDFEKIFDKYRRRIARFRKAIKSNTCFVRTIKNDDELNDIINNREYIDHLIKKSNPANQIIYVGGNFVHFEKPPVFPFFQIDSDYPWGDHEKMRNIFDGCEPLLYFCNSNFDKNKKNENLIFDMKQQITLLKAQRKKEKCRYNMLIQMEHAESAKVPEECIVYGIGNIGKVFYKKFLKDVNVLAFVDKLAVIENFGLYDGIPVIPPSMLCQKQYGNVPIIITPVYEFETIKSEIADIVGEKEPMIISLDEILE